MARDVTINKWAKSDLMGDAGSSQSFCNDSNHDSKHCCPSVEAFNLLELIHVDLACGCVLEPLLVCLGVLHDCEVLIYKT